MENDNFTLSIIILSSFRVERHLISTRKYVLLVLAIYLPYFLQAYT
jgi:hypothetical protein